MIRRLIFKLLLLLVTCSANAFQLFDVYVFAKTGKQKSSFTSTHHVESNGDTFDYDTNNSSGKIGSYKHASFGVSFADFIRIDYSTEIFNHETGFAQRSYASNNDYSRALSIETDTRVQLFNFSVEPLAIFSLVPLINPYISGSTGKAYHDVAPISLRNNSTGEILRITKRTTYDDRAWAAAIGISFPVVLLDRVYGDLSYRYASFGKIEASSSRVDGALSDLKPVTTKMSMRGMQFGLRWHFF